MHEHGGEGVRATGHLVPQEAVVHEDAVQALPQHLVHQRGGHRAVHAAAQGAYDVLLRAHLGAARHAPFPVVLVIFPLSL